MEWTENDIKAYPRGDRKGVYEVVMPDTGQRLSSGEYSLKKAVAWALRRANGGLSPSMTFGEYAKDFFIPGLCRRVTMLEKAHGPNTVLHWDTLRQLLEDYLLPRWGRTLLAAMTPPVIFTWLASPNLVTVREYGGKVRPVANATRNKIRVALKHVLDQAAFEGLLVAGVGSMVPTQRTDSAPTDNYTEEELAKLFPTDRAELLRIWGTLARASIGMILRDSGARPSEVLALTWGRWHPGDEAFISDRRVDRQGLMGPLKGSRKKAGVKKKAVLVSSQTAAVITELRAALGENVAPDDLVFSASRKNQPMIVSALDVIFVGVLERAGVPRVRPGSEGRPRLLYSLKHGVVTETITEYGEEAAQSLVGHTPGSAVTREVYDHPEDIKIIKRARKAVGRG